MTWRLLFQLFGFVELSARGPHLEAFINRAVQAAVYFWDVRRTEDGLRLRAGVRAFRRLRPVARQTHTRLHIEARRGLPFTLRRLARRRVLAGGAAALLVLLYVLSGYVWVVDVRGNRDVPSWEVLSAAERLGLRPGVRKSGLDVDRLSEQLPLLLPRLAWAGVTLHGTKATVEVAERTMPPAGLARESEPADLVAARDGVVTEVLVLAGQAQVRLGDTVRRSQVLISGRLVGGPSGEERLVHARGTVKARVWYDRYVEVGLQQTAVQPTGRSFERHVVRLFGFAVDLGGWRRVPFADYTLDRTSLHATWRGVPLPLEFDTFAYHEVMRLRRQLDERQAAAEAELRARSELRELIPASARILDSDAELVQVTAGRVGVRLRVEAEEDIGASRALAPS